MPKLSVTIITKNEKDDIAAALDSVAWADERIVVDSGSTDGTADIASRCGARVVSREWPGYVAQKNYAASIASCDWILSLDADERVTPALAREVQRILADAPAHRGFRIPRVTFHLGRWIRSTDWYPDDQLRLYDRRVAEWTGRYVHEGVTVKGSIGRLRGELEHHAYRDIAEHLATIDHYTTLAARQMFEEGRRATVWHLAVVPQLTFLRNYLLKGGFREGRAGLIISAMNKYYVFLKFAKLWELERASLEPRTSGTPGTSGTSGTSGT